MDGTMKNFGLNAFSQGVGKPTPYSYISHIFSELNSSVGSWTAIQYVGSSTVV